MPGRDRSNYDRESRCSPPLLHHDSHASHLRRTVDNAYLSLTELLGQPAECLATILLDLYSGESAIDPIVTLNARDAILENIHMGVRGGKAHGLIRRFPHVLQL